VAPAGEAADGYKSGTFHGTGQDYAPVKDILKYVYDKNGGHTTALNVTHCVGDIGNNNGQLVCNGGRPAAPAPPPTRQAETAPYPAPGYAPAPGYPAPGYAPPPRYGEEHGYRERCEGLRHGEHELRDRLAYAPYGEERERLQYRLGQVHTERERQCPRR
jgi:hypothetical protein